MEVKIKAFDDFGRGITHVDNLITFVPNSLPEEVVDISIDKKSKKYQTGSINKIICSCKERIEPVCPHYYECGGCQLMHTTYQKTLEFKKNKINNLLHKFTNYDANIDIVASPKELYYRNKITLKLKDNHIGYYSLKTHEFIPITRCLLAKESINDFLPIIDSLNIINGEITIRSNYNNELLISITTENKINLPTNLNDYKVVGIVLNNKVIYGENHFIEIVNKTLYEVSFDSFFQINETLVPIIFKDIETTIEPDSVILDLYCGVGTLGLAARSKAKQIYGIEIIPNAILNAVRNAKMNKFPNASYHLGDVANIISKINQNIDCVLVDPPRKGLDKKSLKTILEINPKQIVYMSCDPVTLARDLNDLKEHYKIKKITAYDMFPYTYHIESLSILERK